MNLLRILVVLTLGLLRLSPVAEASGPPSAAGPALCARPLAHGVWFGFAKLRIIQQWSCDLRVGKKEGREGFSLQAVSPGSAQSSPSLLQCLANL